MMARRLTRAGRLAIVAPVIALAALATAALILSGAWQQ